MTKSNLSWSASAVLVWLPKGQKPAASFDPTRRGKGTNTPPEPWWELHQAVRYAVELDKKGDDMVPWIKTGDTLLSPEEIQQMYASLGNLGKF